MTTRIGSTLVVACNHVAGGRVKLTQIGIELEFIQPGRPMQNGFNERFNGSCRKGVLDMYVFRNLTEVREHAEPWLQAYNEQIPHESLNDLTPVEYPQVHQPETSSYGWT